MMFMVGDLKRSNYPDAICLVEGVVWIMHLSTYTRLWTLLLDDGENTFLDAGDAIAFTNMMAVPC